MKLIPVTLLAMCVLAGCGGAKPPQEAAAANDPYFRPVIKADSLVAARKVLKTKLIRQTSAQEPAADPPPEVFQKIQYDAPLGKMAAYLTPDPQDGKKHPAIVWITGGDCNTISDVWTESEPDNDQTAAAYRRAGIVMMFPSLRGGNQNPGFNEGMLGEVDDILAATDHLAKQEYVDPSRIYLGGHSTGGTLVLLVAECSDRYRAVFSFGPVDNIKGYGPDHYPVDLEVFAELEARSPSQWLFLIKNPTFVFEGAKEGNIDSLHELERASSNDKIHFLDVTGATHFSVLAPTNRLIAEKLLHDDGPRTNLAFTAEEVSKPFSK